IFFLTAALTLPAVLVMKPLLHLPPSPIVVPRERGISKSIRIAKILSDRRLLMFAACAALFTFGNAATLPLVSTALNKTVGSAASLFIAACIIVPQFIVAFISPAIGRLAESRGRRFVLILGLVALPI